MALALLEGCSKRRQSTPMRTGADGERLLAPGALTRCLRTANVIDVAVRGPTLIGGAKVLLEASEGSPFDPRGGSMVDHGTFRSEPNPAVSSSLWTCEARLPQTESMLAARTAHTGSASATAPTRSSLHYSSFVLRSLGTSSPSTLKPGSLVAFPSRRNRYPWDTSRSIRTRIMARSKRSRVGVGFSIDATPPPMIPA